MGDGSDHIDWEQLDMMADGYTPDFVHIYQEFAAQMPEMLDALEASVSAGDLVAARDIAHKIKGSAANFGFVGVSHPMAGIEVQVKEKGHLEGAGKLVLAARAKFSESCAEVLGRRGV